MVTSIKVLEKFRLLLDFRIIQFVFKGIRLLQIQKSVILDFIVHKIVLVMILSDWILGQCEDRSFLQGLLCGPLLSFGHACVLEVDCIILSFLLNGCTLLLLFSVILSFLLVVSYS